MANAGAFDEPAFMKHLDALIEGVRRADPSITVRRLEWYPTLPGDDLVWYFTRPGCPFEVQVDPGIGAMFLISTDEQPGYAEPASVEEAVGVVRRWLHLDDAA